MSSKPRRGRPPKTEMAEKKTVEIPFDEVRKWVIDTPSLTASEILGKLKWEKTQGNLSKIGKFLKKIKDEERNLRKTLGVNGKNLGNRREKPRYNHRFNLNYGKH